jgi:hypothetical protein
MLLKRRIFRFCSRLDILLNIIKNVDAIARRTFEQSFAAEKALIELQIEWEHFVRDLILDSATGRFENASGPIKSKRYPYLRSREAASHKLITLYPKRRIEPDWYLPAKAIEAAVLLDVTNVAQIAAELGVSPWPIDELRHVRNFIAHKSKRAALNVRGTSIVNPSSSIDILDIAFQYSPSGTKYYLEWIVFSKGVAARLVA